MSLSVATLELMIPPKPQNTRPENLAMVCLGAIARQMPFKYGSLYYTPEMAIRHKEGNCFAQTLASVAILQAWGIPPGVALMRNGNRSLHAYTLFGLKDKTYVIDGCISPRHCKPIIEDLRQRIGLRFDHQQAYKSQITTGIDRQNLALYLMDEDPAPQQLQSKRIRRSVPQGEPYAQGIMTDATRGNDMLRAIGDLSRYLARYPERYAEEYDHLLPHIPHFVLLPLPETITPN